MRRRKLAAFIIMLMVFTTGITGFGAPEGEEGPGKKVMVVSTYPLLHQGDIEVNPTLKISFESSMILLKENGIELMAEDGEIYPLASYQISTSLEGQDLIIDIGGGQTPLLRRNTSYTLTIPQGVVGLVDNPAIVNDPIILTFVTTSQAKAPQVAGYSSQASGGDNIASLTGSKLARDGNIYICFHEKIRWAKGVDPSDLLKNIELYRIPAPDKRDYDDKGALYDREFVYDVGITEGGLRNSQWRMAAGEVDLVEDKALRIKPAEPLLNLNQYRLKIPSGFLEDHHGHRMENPVDFFFWTATAPENPLIQWEGVEGIPAVNFQESIEAGIKTYTVKRAPAYGKDRPVVLLVDGEIHPKAGEVQKLKDIVLMEGYDDKNAVKISKVKLEHFFSGHVKKTKLYLYPEAEALDPGKYYILRFSQEVFQGRGGQFLPPLTVKFTVVGDRSQSPGITRLTPSALQLLDLFQGHAAFTLQGHNFHEDVEWVSLTMVGGEAAGTVSAAVYKGDIEYISTTDLLVKLRDKDVINKLYHGGSGEYAMKVKFSGHPAVAADTPLELLSRGRPRVKALDPVDGGTSYNEKALRSRIVDGTRRYFLTVTYEDIDEKLMFNADGGLNFLQTSHLFSSGQNEVSMIDGEFLGYIQGLEDAKQREEYISGYIFEKNSSQKEAYLYIPVKPLRSQTTYTVMINPGVVSRTGPDPQDADSEAIMWSFSTSAVPMITGVQIGSVPEDYDEDIPILLQGDFFSRGVEVYFNDIKARRTRITTDREGKPLLEVFLPTGRNRLSPGIYTILVSNDGDHDYEDFGALSVVKQGAHVPQEDYKVKVEKRVGQVRSDLSRSEDTLVLDRRYADVWHLEVDLDELMGEEVVVRNIEFPARETVFIGTLETASKWADITLQGVMRLGHRSDVPKLTLGRVESTLAQALTSKLERPRLKSDLIQVAGEHLWISGVNLALPYKESEGEKLRVLRYDNDTREWEDVKISFVDKTLSTVNFTSNTFGIFAVVE